MNTNAERLIELFSQASQKPLAERDAFLDQLCHGDSELRRQLETLLRSHAQAANFLEDAAATQLAPASPNIPAIMHERPGTVIGRYKLLQEIGEGGCGVVYMAEQQEPVIRRVALKVIKLGMDTKQVVARFEAERQALARMDHPNIAKVLDGGTTEAGRPYFVMELVRGMKITEFCDEQNLPTSERLKLFVQVCQAVQHAHQKGIIHRDLKPSNILVTVNDGVPTPKVIDFGIAKATEGRLTDKTLFTTFEQFIGTPAYMSPEQMGLSSLDIDTRSDIYSLGVLLYELLTGKTPFDAKELLGAGLDEMRRTVREKEPARPSTRVGTLQSEELSSTAKRRGLEAPRLIPLLSGDLDWIVMKALEKDRARRYETANGFGADIQRYLNNEPVQARPPSATYRLQKTIRRNKLVFAAASAVTLALIAGLSFSTWALLREAAQRRIAVEQQNKAASAQQAEKQARLQADELKAKAEHQLYVANVNLAQQAWEQNNVGRLRELLDETANFPKRGFEWYYWQRQTHLEIATFHEHTPAVCSVAFSPEGERVVSGSWDRLAKVWEAGTGKELFVLEGHQGAVMAVAYSLDGKRIVTGSLDQTAKIWDAATGESLLTIRGQDSDIYSAAFAPDGDTAVTGGKDGVAQVWDAHTGGRLMALRGHSNCLNAVAFSPNGRRIVTGSEDRTAKVWDTATGQELVTLNGHTDVIRAAVFSPDGRKILTGSFDHTARVWDTETGRELRAIRGHQDEIRAAAFSPDGQRIVTGSHDQTAKVWDAASGQELMTLKGHSGALSSVAFSKDGRRIVTGTGDWMPNADHTVKVWDARVSREQLILRGHTGNVQAVAFSPDGMRMVTASEDHLAKIWAVANGQELLTFRDHTDTISSVAFSPDGQRIVTAGLDNTARVWDASSGQTQWVILTGHSNTLTHVAFSPDGQRIVTTGTDATAKVWDTAAGRLLFTISAGCGRLWFACFSPDGKRLITCGDSTAKIWDAATAEPLLSLDTHSIMVKCASFSPDGYRVLTGNSDWTAKVWNADNGDILLTFNGHRDRVWGVGFSMDGQRVVTGSPDGTVKLWDANIAKELLTLKVEGARVSSVAFSPDGRRIVAGLDDNTARLWEAAAPDQVAAWHENEIGGPRLR